MIRSVCYFGPIDGSYPRNRIIRRGLELAGVDVRLCTVPNVTPSPQRQFRLARAYLRGPAADVLYVPEFAQTTLPLAWALSRPRRRRVVMDFFVSHYHAVVAESRKHAAGDARARYFRAADATALRLADVAVVDTRAHADFFAADFRIPREKLVVSYVGYDDEIFVPQPPPANDEFRVLFYGSYLPLHGAATIVDAAARLAGSHPDIRFRFIGKGLESAAVREAAAARNLTSIEFVDGVPYAALPAEIAAASVCLGIFGNTAQSERVIPNKVFQCLAVGRAVITRDSVAVRELFRDGEHLSLVPAADPEALAAAIRQLHGDRQLRERLAQQGRLEVARAFQPRALGARLAQDLGALLA